VLKDGLFWLATTNLIIWTGLFLYLLRLERKIEQPEDER
jgi:CcmD family protein